MSRRTYNRITIAMRHPRLFAQMAAPFKLQFWPTKTDGTHIVAVNPHGVVCQVGVLWK
jgi:hypothetical protein